MLEKMPIFLEKVPKGQIDMEILRLGMIAELDAINLYEQLAAATQDENIKKVCLDIAKEEKTHLGEFQTMLLRLDKEQVEEMKEAEEEIKELTGK